MTWIPANVPARFWLWRHRNHRHLDLTGDTWVCSCGSSHPRPGPPGDVTTPARGTAEQDATEVLVRHSRCRPSDARTGDGKVSYDCGIAVPVTLASSYHHQALALAESGLLCVSPPIGGADGE